MTREQAAKEFARLCAEIGKNPKDLTPEQTATWLKTLQGMPYEKGRLAIDAVRDNWEHSYFPPIGFLNGRAKKLGYDGVPNAIAYSQNGDHTPWSQTQDAAFIVWRQVQIEKMLFPVALHDEPETVEDDEERIHVMERRYWAYVYNEDHRYRRLCEQKWRLMWNQGAA